ncbi:NFX1-type zinc finger-containing protein 1 [Argiope bruennichi]|uniref:NFX1-type zinc finger-containing protein 1 n=2 Tax=Argiope bruennichi TaxID=94029 RepID=A0A8T0E9Q9_ARGBR|nr:NFX1-type zinc finger-containing protein 1 [Argiope bruennichi]
MSKIRSSHDLDKKELDKSSSIYIAEHSIRPLQNNTNYEAQHNIRPNTNLLLGFQDFNSTSRNFSAAPGSERRRRLQPLERCYQPLESCYQPLERCYQPLVRRYQRSDILWGIKDSVWSFDQAATHSFTRADKWEMDRYVKPMSRTELESLLHKSPEWILCTILSEDPSFCAILKEQVVSRNIMALVLLVLQKATTSHLPQNVIAMIDYVVRSDKFLFSKFYAFLQSYEDQSINIPYHWNSFLSLSELLVKILTFVPLSYLEPFLDALDTNAQTLEIACHTYLREDDQLCCEISKNLKTFETKLYASLYDCGPIKGEQVCCTEKLQPQNSPEDYRSIPVLPTIKDIHSPCVFLQPNLIKGSYEDCKHYLDVQFRLCREDYVKTIRDGIAEYLSLKKQEKSLNGCKHVRVYSDVRIIQQEFVHGELVHLARFSDEKFSKIKWENSKRFLTGSLLCLSSDDFETILFATVVRRQPKELREGLLLLRFEEITYEVLTLTRLRSFVVMETSAYFEAYRHNLQALQEVEITKFPMKSHIVELQKYVLKPAYRTESTVYDIRPLLLPLSRSSVEKCIKDFGVVKTIYKFDMVSDKRILEKAKLLPIFSDECWPSAAELKLDPSQYAAIKTALTKRFALIQGPPGTGKTYVGLRIVQLLLHNLYGGTCKPNRPIMVVCYTNRALDQFLEGVLKFSTQIVRIGGRSTNDLVSRFQLHNLRKIVEQKKIIPNHLFKLIQQRKYELRCLIKRICLIKQYVERCHSAVLRLDILEDSMSSEHYDTLKRLCLSAHDETVMYIWLGIETTLEYPSKNQANCKNDESLFSDICAQNSNPADLCASKEDEYEEECDETEVEFIEAFRSISSEEFADFVIDVNKDEFSQENDALYNIHFRYTMRNKKRNFTGDLATIKAMTEEEVRKIDCILSLPYVDRWRLYKFWLELHTSKKQKEILEMQTVLQTKLVELKELQSEVDLFTCRPAHVIGITTTGAAKYRNIVKRLNPMIVVFEEAAEILESHIVTSLTSTTEHVILIGDHQQLKPSPSVHDLAVQYDLNVSLFERMVKNGMPCNKLSIQHRMRPEIASLLVPHFYEDLKNHELVSKYENMKGIKKNVFFITHSYNELHEFDTRSKTNQHEATFLIKLCKYILLQGYKPTQITVLTTYSGQLLVLKRLAGDGILKNVKFTVVDNYQGEENDIILVSFVRSNEEGEIGFLKVPNRICVALSRAKKALYCVGNFGMLKEKSLVWKNIIQILEENQAIGPSLQLFCQNHPDTTNVVTFEKDFDTLREGGCSRICGFILACGHPCQLMCHPYDKKHEKVRCLESCDRKCMYGHSCKKTCSEACGPCSVFVERQVEPCGHIINVYCFRRDSNVLKCDKPCEKILACGHQCQNICSSVCTSKCLKKEKIASSVCGHSVEVECCKSGDLLHLAKICKKPCNMKLSCGHECQGTCSKCYQGRLHISCTQPCKRILICGHECTSSCSRNCPPCKYPCENRCSHGRCPRKCCEPCVKCHQPCEWSCPHQKCNQMCAEECSRDICYEPCAKILNCGHPCIGLCGEFCPKECRKCDKETVQKKFFGTEDQEDARFVRLENCGHIFELLGLMRWMKTYIQEQREIRLMSCPECKQVIRRSFCFGKVIKSCLEDIEKVKNITCGNIYRNFFIQNSLMEKIKSNIHKIPEFCLPIVKSLKSVYGRSLIEITTIENLFNLALLLAEEMQFFDNRPKVKEYQIYNSYHELVRFMSLNKKLIIDFMIDEFLTASDQQLIELNWEIHRLKVADKLLKFVFANSHIKSHAELSSLVHCIASFQPFREEKAREFAALLHVHYDGFNVDFSALVEPASLNVLNLSKDYWYICPFQHVCFSTSREDQCSVCGSKIDGKNVALQTNNAIADERDAASQPVFSELIESQHFLNNVISLLQFDYCDP